MFQNAVCLSALSVCNSLLKTTNVSFYSYNLTGTWWYHLGFFSVTGLDACKGLPIGSEELDICVGSNFSSVTSEEGTTGDT